MLRPWEFNISIARDSAAPLHAQVSARIIEEIQLGRLPPGTILPGSRELSRKLNLNRKTIVQAYDNLTAQGWLTAENKRGTFVSPHAAALGQHSIPFHQQPSSPGYRLPDPASFPGISILKKPDFINLSEDIPDPRLMPFTVLSRTLRHALISSMRSGMLQQSDPRGSAVLRGALQRMLNLEKGLHTAPDNICVVRGSQMGVFLVARALIKAGDCIVVEQLSNPAAREAFRDCGATLLTVPHDQDGLDMLTLEKLCINYKVKAIYVSPGRQIPTTACMSAENRNGLLALAKRYDFIIIEDDSSSEFNHSASPQLPIASQDLSGRVIYISSFSQTLTPALRTGYVAAPVPLVEHFARDISMIDRHGNEALELAIAELLLSGEIKRHFAKASKTYRKRMENACWLVESELQEIATTIHPKTGLSLWLSFISHIHIPQLVQDARYAGITLSHPGIYGMDDALPQGLSVAFGHLSDEELHRGITLIRQACLKQYPQALRA